MGQVEPQQTKPWYKSSTVWVNAASCAAIILEYAMGNHWIDPKYMEAALALFNLLNRFRTDTAVTLPGQGGN